MTRNEPAVVALLVSGLVFLFVGSACHVIPPLAKIFFPKASHRATGNLYLMMGTLLVLWWLYDEGIIHHK